MTAMETILLLGWMERDAALSYLCKDCMDLPPFSETEAESLWSEYRARVEALPERAAKSPARLNLTSEEMDAAEKFLAPHAGNPHIRDVVKVNPMGLVVHQLYMTLDKAKQYMDHAAERSWCRRQCLAVRPKGVMWLDGNFMRNAADIKVPHREFAANFIPGNTFGVEELGAHVSATEFGDRMLLWAGYHRAYARMASMKPDAAERSLLVVLSKDADHIVAPDSPDPRLRATLLGARPPIFADFFDDRLFLKLKLRKKRYELRIRASIVPVDDDA
ncbi:MAG: hypothetical protein WCA20_04065 [Candidatus Sulfotelmatobacter sp.]